MFGIITPRYIVSSIIPYSITLIYTYWNILKYIEIYWRYSFVVALRFECFDRAGAGPSLEAALAMHSPLTAAAKSSSSCRAPTLFSFVGQWKPSDWSWSTFIKSYQVIFIKSFEMNPFVSFENDWNCAPSDVNGCQWMVMGWINSKSWWNAQQTAETCCVLSNASVCSFSADLQRRLWAVLGLRIAAHGRTFKCNSNATSMCKLQSTNMQDHFCSGAASIPQQNTSHKPFGTFWNTNRWPPPDESGSKCMKGRQGELKV